MTFGAMDEETWDDFITICDYCGSEFNSEESGGDCTACDGIFCTDHLPQESHDCGELY